MAVKEENIIVDGLRVTKKKAVVATEQGLVELITLL